MHTNRLKKIAPGGWKSLLAALIAAGALAACDDSSSSGSGSGDDDNGGGSGDGSGSASGDFDFNIEIDAKAATELDYKKTYSGETGLASINGQSSAALAVDVLAAGDFFRLLLNELQDEFTASGTDTYNSDTACADSSGSVSYAVSGGGATSPEFSYDFDGYCIAMPRNYVDGDGNPDGPLGDIVLTGEMLITRESEGDLTADFWTFEDLQITAWGETWTLNGKKQNAGELNVGSHRATAIDFEVDGEAYRYLSDRGTYVDPDVILRGFTPADGFVYATGSAFGITAEYAFRYRSDGCDGSGTNPPYPDLGNVDMTGGADAELTAKLGEPDTCSLYELSGSLSDGSEQAATDIELYSSILN